MPETPWSINISWEYNSWITHDYCYEYNNAEWSILITDNVFEKMLYTLNEWNDFSSDTTHITPRDWYELVWFVLNGEYTDYDSSDQEQRTKTFTNLKVYKWDSQTFKSLVSDNPYRATDNDYVDSQCGFVLTVDTIRKDNQNNKIVTSYKDNIQYLLWWSGGGNSYAPNSPDKPKYHRVWPEEDYQALENKYTEQEGDTMYFTY